MKTHLVHAIALFAAGSAALGCLAMSLASAHQPVGGTAYEIEGDGLVLPADLGFGVHSNDPVEVRFFRIEETGASGNVVQTDLDPETFFDNCIVWHHALIFAEGQETDHVLLTAQARSDRLLPGNSSGRLLYPFGPYPVGSAPVAIRVTVEVGIGDRSSLLVWDLAPEVPAEAEGCVFPVAPVAGLQWEVADGHEATSGNRRHIEMVPSGIGDTVVPRFTRRMGHEITLVDAGGKDGHRNLLDAEEVDPLASMSSLGWARPVARDGGSAPTGNANYYAWDREVRAVEDGVVVAMTRDLPDVAPGLAGPGDGNHLILHHPATGRFSKYAGLKVDSIPVEFFIGFSVQAGQAIGRIGHSGAGARPALFFMMVDGFDPVLAEGLPVVLDDIDVRLAGEAANRGAYRGSLPSGTRVFPRY